MDMDLNGYQYTWERGFEVLSIWGKEITGNFKDRINKSKRALKTLKGRRDEQSIKLVQEEKKKLVETYAQQEVFWRQRSKQFWLREGDQNSRFFHLATKIKRKANHISSLTDYVGNKVSWESGIEQVIINYFNQLFTASNKDWSQVVNCVPSKVMRAHNDFLLADVDEKEVKQALFNMHPDKSPGPDGMSPGFYQNCWKIIKADVVSRVQNFFSTGSIDSQLQGTNIVLIPKKYNPVYMTDIHPMSLCNMVYNIISNVLANRMKQVIESIISKFQSAFISRRLITDNIMIAFEVMHYMRRKTKGKDYWMALKLDMSKAYDRVE
ncbi:hypothetical protein AgCh_035686 [Apium graveolens]